MAFRKKFRRDTGLNSDRMKKLHVIIAAVLNLIALSACSAWCMESVVPETGVSIKADILSHNQSDDTITASGDVFLIWQGMTLMAMNASYSRQTQIITASGNVVLIKGGDIVRGSRLSFDTISGRGEIEDSTMFIRQGNIHRGDKKPKAPGETVLAEGQDSYSIHLTGKRIIKLGENDYSAEQGTYTTCDAENPSWKFGASRLDVAVDEYGTGKHAVFYIKDVPVFYFPYIIFPGKRERQTGFLYPHLGWSKSKGAEVDIPFFWAISPSQDATVDLDIQSKRGVGTGLEYRYLRSQGSTGNLGGYLIYDQNTASFRGVVAQSHREIFSPDMNLRTSINMTTDRNFLSDYGEKTGDYNRQSNDSTVNFLKTWQQYTLTAKLRYTQDYYAASNANTLQTLPEIGLAAVRQQVYATPLYFDLDSRASNFYRETGMRGQRGYAFPRLTLVTGLPGYLNISAYGGTHLRAYNTENINPASQTHGGDGSLLPEAGIRLSTPFSRVYDIDGESVRKLRHEIIPEISYTYSSDQDQSRFPLYDYTDRIPHQNIMYYSLTSLLGGKFRVGETSEYRDLMRLKLTQGYSISGTRRDLLTMVDTNRHLTDVMLESDTWVHSLARLTFDARYNVYGNYVSSAAPGLEFDDKRGTTAGLSYRMAHYEVGYLEAHMSTRILKPWTFGYATRYSFDRNDSLESVYSAEYRHQCWSIMAAYRDRPTGQSFMVNFSLMGTFGMGSAQSGLQGGSSQSGLPVR
jgi:LPS-assembly protein